MEFPKDDLFCEIVTAAPEAIVFADREGRVRLWNRAAESMFGFSAFRILLPRDAAGRVAGAVAIIREVMERWEEERRLRRRRAELEGKSRLPGRS